MSRLATTKLAEIVGVPVSKIGVWLARGSLALQDPAPRAAPGDARTWNLPDSMRLGVFADLLERNVTHKVARDRTEEIVEHIFDVFKATQRPDADPKWKSAVLIFFTTSWPNGTHENHHVRSLADAAYHFNLMLQHGAVRIDAYDATPLYVSVLKAFREEEIREEEAAEARAEARVAVPA